MTIARETNALLNDLTEALGSAFSTVCVAVIVQDENAPRHVMGDPEAAQLFPLFASVQETLTDGIPRVDEPPSGTAMVGAAFIAVEPLSIPYLEPATVIAFAGQYWHERERAVALVQALATETANELILRNQAPFLASALAEAECGVTIADPNLPDTPLVYVNAAFARMTGYPKAEVLGRNCRFLQGHLRDQPGVQKIRNALERGVDCTTVLTNIRRDGTPFENRLKLRPIRADDGTLSHIIGIQLDVTAEHSALESLDLQKRRYESLIEAERSYIWRMNAAGEIQHVSESWLVLAGLSSSGQLPDPAAIRGALAEEAAEAFRRGWAEALANLTPFEVIYQLPAQSQSPKWFLDRVTPVLDDKGALLEWVAASQEITELKHAELELQQTVDAAPIGMLVIDREGTITLANAEATLLFGYSQAELVGMSVDALVPASVQSQHESMRAAFRATSSTRRMGFKREVEGRRQDGSQFALEVGLSSFGEGDDFRVIAACTDTSELNDARKSVERAAYEDGLTGLLSRSGFARRLDERLAEGDLHPASLVVVVDIKALREINNAQGYEVGDEVLREVARRLTAEVGEHGLVARTGGDEFIVLAPVENRRTPRQWRQRLTAVFDAPFRIRDFALHIEASFGYTRIQSSAGDSQKLINDAGLVLHQSQSDPTRSWTQYTQALERQTRETVAMTTQLRHAVEENELTLYYQPKVDLASGRIVSAEALLRWHHPEKGMIPPDRFIPLAEASQLIGPIGDWLLRQACRDIRAWRYAGVAPIPVSVNLSLIQFQLGNVPDKVRQALNDYDVAPEQLTLEITESVFEQHGQALKQDLDALSAMGVHLSLDDFGTGYSSLGHLKDYPFDEIKIDKSFVWQLHESSYGRAIVEAVILIAASIDAEVVAEGIESAAHVTTLQQLGCTKGQGFYYSRPIPEPSWRQLLIDQKML